MINNVINVETWTVDDLVQALGEKPPKKKKIDIPKYQRNLVWSTLQKRTFIESIKAGFPIGSILLFNSGADNSRFADFKLGF